MDKPEAKKPANQPPVKRDGVSHDTQGNVVWQWAVDSGRQLVESTSLLLKRLDVPGLKLEEDANAPKKETKPAAKPAKSVESKASAGYDPYGHKSVPPTPRPRADATKPAAAPGTRRSWWQRLFRRD